MPSHTAHAYLDRLYFGKVYWKVHKRMDSAWMVCRKGHRRFFHDWLSAYAIAVNAYPGDENAVWSAWLHIQTDEYCSANPEFRRELERLARADAKNQERRRERIKKPPDQLTEFVRFLEKIRRIQEMARLLSK